MTLENKKILLIVLTFFISSIFILIYNQRNILFIDDAFITFRYAENFSNGYGLVYNNGERVYGTTTPGYAMLLGSIKFLFRLIINYNIDLLLLSQIISIVAISSILYFMIKIIQVNLSILIFLFLILFVSETNFIVLYSGMETFFVILLLILILFNFENKVAIILSPLMLLFRFDIGVLLIITLVIKDVIRLISEQKYMYKFYKNIFLIIGSTLIVLCFLYLTFDTIIPNTILAKSIIYKGTVFEQKFIERLNYLIRMGLSLYISIPAIILLLILFFKKIISKNLYFVHFYIFVLCYFFFELLFVTHLNQWYMPILNFCIIFILTLELKNSLYQMKTKYKVMIYLLLLILLGYSFNKNNYIKMNNSNSLFFSELYINSLLIKKDAKVFCGDIGVIGFYSKAYIYDYAGLVTPEAINYNKHKYYYKEANGFLTHYNAIIDQIKNLKPDFLNFRKSYPFVKYVLNDDYLKSNYKIVNEGYQEILLKRI